MAWIVAPKPNFLSRNTAAGTASNVSIPLPSSQTEGSIQFIIAFNVLYATGAALLLVILL
ncbi:hypothetical protein BDN70DRAFT_880598 [Pholiota conissans]|uniref:Uncharacterized protein n=1 Tax=Pholiota conissans TaxID=109636 RepID=A0A9P6CZ21_9AGAR|nr:hypothetical protein BDN70DRAFT_880598 [Pholiota conissans]